MTDNGQGHDRLDRIVEVLMAYARQDFTPRLEVSERLDDIDAIATGINMLAEELHGEVASRRDLEAALASLKSTQEQLMVAEKLAAIGELASGVAHELNNPSTWVLLGLELVDRRVTALRALAAGTQPIPPSVLAPAIASLDDSLVDIRSGLERMRSVITDLGMLTKHDARRMGLVDLDDVVRAACQLARPAYNSIASLTLELGGIPPIAGDRARLGQVVTNLVVNAAHALSNGDVRTNSIKVRTSVDGNHGVLIVEDNGPGIPDALRQRVFEPYFTTKPADVGTGLGLPLVRRIAEQHGGKAQVIDCSGGGACVEVRLPLAPPAVAAPPTRQSTPRMHIAAATSASMITGPAPSGRDHRPRILLIDDEPLLLRTMEETLQDDAQVVTALGGDAALELLARDRKFDLVICDLQMPRTDGAAVHGALAELAPELIPRLVIMSGGAVTPRARQFLERVRPRMLAKPFAIEEALALVDPAALE